MVNKHDSRRNASRPPPAKRSSVASSPGGDSLERAWIDAEEIWKATEPLTGSVTAAHVAAMSSSGKSKGRPSASPASPASVVRGRSSGGRASGPRAQDSLAAIAEELHTPSSQLLSQQQHEHALVEPTGIATALFATDATIAAKPMRAYTTGALSAQTPRSSLSYRHSSGTPAGQVMGGLSSSSPSDRSSRGTPAAVDAGETSESNRRGRHSHRASSGSVGSGLWSPHDPTVRAMLLADPPTATRVVQLQKGYTMPSPQTPLWSQLSLDREDEDDEDEEPVRRSTVRRHRREQDTPKTAAFALADSSVALVSGDSELYPRVCSNTQEGADEESTQQSIGLSLTQEALALDAQANQPYSAPLFRRRGPRHNAHHLPENSVEADVAWTIARPGREEGSQGRPPARVGKRSRSSVALVGASDPTVGGGVYAAWGHSTRLGDRASYATSAVRAERSHSTGMRVSGSQQQRLESWAAQQRQFFRFIDERPMLTVRESDAALTRKQKKNRVAGDRRGAAARPSPSARQSPSHGPAAAAPTASSTARKKPSLMLVSRFGGVASRQPSRHQSLALPSATASVIGSVPRVDQEASAFAQFVSNVKKRGTVAASSTSADATQ